ncbi:unnamed protein product [Paramecium sonneborni]|uniref:Vacuolar protein-sorting-associated protein 36 n=1 Tax=Paramecium sonneborni TaxID=65129 RepID=A0A8S1RJU3_9CILI|nr:unnamed protein product [Paramecium sonneborni]
MQQSLFFLSAEMTAMTQFNEKTLFIYQNMQFLDKKLKMKVPKLNLVITTHRLIFTNNPNIEQLKTNDAQFVYLVVPLQHIKTVQTKTGFLSSQIDHINFETNLGDVSLYGDNLEGPLLQIKGSMEKKEWLKVQEQQQTQSVYRGLKSELDKKEKQTQQTIETVQSTFKGGFEELFKNASELKEISQYIKQNIKKGENNEIDEILSKIGQSRLDKTEDQFYEKLAEQVYKLCVELFPKMGGIISLLDVYYYFNKKRNQNLVSPEEILKAGLQFQKLNYQAKIERYDGISVFESTQYNIDKDYENTLGKFISYEVGLTAEQLAKKLGISVMICKIKLRNAINQGKVCVDNRIEGTRYFQNLIINI